MGGVQAIARRKLVRGHYSLPHKAQTVILGVHSRNAQIFAKYIQSPRRQGGDINDSRGVATAGAAARGRAVPAAVIANHHG